MGAVIELKPLGDFWQLTHDGTVIACAVTRDGVINTAAALLRRQLKDPARAAGLSLVGMELTELLTARPMAPNWKRKGPPIESEQFARAEAYLQTELLPSDEAELFGEYRAGLRDENLNRALECLVELGVRQDCTHSFWKILEQLAEAIWPTKWMVDRRAKGQRETRIALIQQRARGRVEPPAVADRRSRKRLRGS